MHEPALQHSFASFRTERHSLHLEALFALPESLMQCLSALHPASRQATCNTTLVRPLLGELPCNLSLPASGFARPYVTHAAVMVKRRTASSVAGAVQVLSKAGMPNGRPWLSRKQAKSSRRKSRRAD